MSQHLYPLPSLLLDGARATIGLLATSVPLLLLDVAWPIRWVLGVLSVVFVLFAFKVVRQTFSSIELGKEGIARRGPFQQELVWTDLKIVKLAHYTTPKRRSDGWYQLTLKGEGRAFRVESTIDGFDDIVSAALRAAKAAGLPLDPTTGDNLRGLGHELG